MRYFFTVVLLFSSTAFASDRPDPLLTQTIEEKETFIKEVFADAHVQEVIIALNERCDNYLSIANIKAVLKSDDFSKLSADILYTPTCKYSTIKASE